MTTVEIRNRKWALELTSTLAFSRRYDALWCEAACSHEKGL
jgi:hypothetical protein